MSLAWYMSAKINIGRVFARFVDVGNSTAITDPHPMIIRQIEVRFGDVDDVSA